MCDSRQATSTSCHFPMASSTRRLPIQCCSTCASQCGPWRSCGACCARVALPESATGIFGGRLIAPETPLLQQWFRLLDRVRQHYGVNFYIGRHHRRLLLDAGFVRAEASASIQSEGSLKATRQFAVSLKARIPGNARTALAEGWIDQATVDAIAADIDAWAERPDAFQAEPYCHALGWVSD